MNPTDAELDEMRGWLHRVASPIERPMPLDEPELERRVRRVKREAEKADMIRRRKHSNATQR